MRGKEWQFACQHGDPAVNIPHAKALRTKQCVPWAGGIPRYTVPQITEQVKELPDWQ